MMYPLIQTYCDKLVQNFSEISDERKLLLGKIAQYMTDKRQKNQAIQLMYVCTHNSRRSHFGQIWAQIAASYFQIEKLKTYSGGTEATAFHANAIAAIKRVGAQVTALNESANPHYHIQFSDTKEPILCFSKVYNHESNPTKEFAAIMTCGDAEQNCPFIPGVELRIATTYEDPKAFDNTSLQDQKYDERCRQIALETFYAFSLVK